MTIGDEKMGTRSSDWRDGRRNGIKWAIRFVHEYAATMNDPSAKMALDTCADTMGKTAKGLMDWPILAALKEPTNA